MAAATATEMAGSKGQDAAADAITVECSRSVQTPQKEVKTRRDKAAEFLANTTESHEFTVEEEKKLVRRIDFRVLTLLLGAYFFQQLDKSSLSFVAIFGISEDANLVGKQFSWLGSILYFAQLVMQPLAAWLLVKMPNGKVIAAAIFLWGSSLAIMAACTNFGGLMTMRFFLGAFESMIAPSCVAVTQMWWRRGEQTMRTSWWNAMNGVAYILGSLFTYGLGHIRSNVLFSYQIIFLFCGLLTIAYAVIVLVLMPDSPMEAKFLSEREKVIAVQRLRANQMGVMSRHWRWDHVLEAFYDLKTWTWFFLIISISIPSGGIGTFGSLIVQSFGYTNFEAILFNLPVGVLQILAILGGGWAATKIRKKGLVIRFFALFAAAGTVIMLTVPRSNKGVLLLGHYMVNCLAAITPLVYAWQAQNTAGDTKRKCTSGVVFVGMCTGNIIGPQLYSTSQAPEYRPGLTSSLVMFLLVALFAVTSMLYLMFLNRRHAKKRQELGGSARIIDESMMEKKKIESSKAMQLEAEEGGGGSGTAQQQSLEEDKGLADMTDLKNENFIYVY
ncbi:hypothetical protein VTO42DRAFT_7585 [Malbranchea cinnamomea]